jgi:glycosyltransferase involved in cell wall biosynthesis
MNAIFNKSSLTLVVPTYNREAILKAWLEHHVKLMFLNGVEIFIQDNASTDGTKSLLESWQKKFNNITYRVNDVHLSAQSNLESVLNFVYNDFLWPVADSYKVDNILLSKVLSIVKNTSSLFLITNLEGRKKNFIKSELDFNLVIEELSGILSCSSCVVYNKRLLGKIVFEEKSWSWFPHTLYILNQLRIKNEKAHWVSLSIEVLRSIDKKNWANTQDVFEIGCKNWIISLDSISGLSSKSKKKAYADFSKITNLFSLKGAVWLRAQGLLSFNLINHYKPYLKKSVGINYLLFYLVAIIPENFLQILRKIYCKCYRKH